MQTEVSNYPKLSEGFFKNGLFRDEDGNTKWVVGDLNAGSQFMLRDDQMADFERILEHLDGNNSIEEIAVKSKKSVREVTAALDYMEKKGLIEGVEGVKDTRFNEVDQFSISLYTHYFSAVKKQRTREISRLLLKAGDLLILINLIVFLWNLMVLGRFNMPLSHLLSYGMGKNSKLLGYILINVGMVFSFFLHEVAHLLTGIKNGINPEKFQFSLFLGFIPLFYIKNKNIYSLSSKQILEILLAGIKMNFLLFLLLMNIFVINEIEILKILALSNFRILLVNLFPLTLTDGYFVLTILTGRSNLRQKYHMFLADPRQWKTFFHDEKIYVILAFITLIFTLTLEFQWILTMLPIYDEIIRIALTVSLLCGYVYFMHHRNVRRFSMTVGGQE